VTIPSETDRKTEWYQLHRDKFFAVVDFKMNRPTSKYGRIDKWVKKWSKDEEKKN